MSNTRWVLKKYKKTKPLPQLPSEIWKTIIADDLTSYLNTVVTCKVLYYGEHSKLFDLICRLLKSDFGLNFLTIKKIDRNLLIACGKGQRKNHFLKYLRFKYCNYKISDCELFWPCWYKSKYIDQDDDICTMLPHAIVYFANEGMILDDEYDLIREDMKDNTKLFHPENVRKYINIYDRLCAINNNLEEYFLIEREFFRVLKAEIVKACNMRRKLYNSEFNYHMFFWFEEVDNDISELFDLIQYGRKI